ncbi:hypothetical protein Tco_0008340, partial [Tanacetum coccineum]
MNLENAAQKIVEQYPPTEIFSSIVETAVLHNNVFDSGALDELCMEEELAQVSRFPQSVYAHDLTLLCRGGNFNPFA